VIALVRTEFVKAARRTRTLIIAALLIGLPTLIAVAIHSRGDRPGRDNGEGLFRLAQQSGIMVPAAVLGVMSGFLLIVITGTFVGDSVAGEAAWGNLRYVLMRPVTRGRLLVAKAIVADVLVWACTFLVSIAALIAGVILFGSHAVTVPAFVGSSGGFTIPVGTLVARVALGTAYVAFGYTALLGLGMLFSTLTDAATSAIGATVGVYIVSEILDGISQLGRIRYGLPTHYLSAWEAMLTKNQYPSDMVVGVAVQLVYLAVFGTAAVIWFRRKDIRS
jgi:ABC-2 type transport system permease protein